MVLFWVERGVRIFRVNNPHTKPIGFWSLADPGRSGRAAPGRRVPVGGLHQPGAHVRARRGRLQPVVHLLHLEERQGRADRLRHRAGRAGVEEFFRPNFFTNIAVPWSIAIGSDFAYPGTTGPKPAGTDLVNRYMERVTRAGQRDDAVALRFNEVAAFVRPPGSLLTPTFILRVLRASRRQRRAAAQANTARPDLSRPHTARR